MDLQSRLRRQHGVLTTRQAKTAGLSPDAIRWRVTDGQWTRLAPGLFYAYPGQMTWMGRAQALTLKLGEGGALTGESAAYLHGVQPSPPAIITGSVVGRQVRRLPGTRVSRRSSLDVASRKGLPVTTAASTVLDCCAHYGPGQWKDIVHLLARWVHGATVTAPEIMAQMERRRRYVHRDLVTTALAPIAGGVESALELQAIQGVIISHGLPMPTLQVRDYSADGEVRRDAEWEKYGVVLECDGVLFHTGASAQADRRRDRHTARSGRVTVRAGYVEIVYGPCDLALDLFLTLRSRGYRGPIVPCGQGCVARAGSAA